MEALCSQSSLVIGSPQSAAKDPEKGNLAQSETPPWNVPVCSKWTSVLGQKWGTVPDDQSKAPQHPMARPSSGRHAQSPVAQSAGEPQWGESRDRLALPGSPGANRVGGPSSGEGPGCEDWALGKGLGGRTGLWGRVFSLL